MMRKFFATVVFSTAAMVALPGSAQSFVNGNFEAPGGDGVRTQISDGSPASLGGGDLLTGWSHSGGSFDIYESDDTGDGLAAQSGTHYVSFGHSGTAGGMISQTFGTIAGQRYTVGYYVAEQQGDDAAQVLRAILTNGSQTLTRDNSGLSLVFLPGLSINFVALGSTATISFLDATNASLAGGGANLALDSVSITRAVSAVPEPTTWAMMISGLGLVGASLRRRISVAARIA